MLKFGKQAIEKSHQSTWNYEAFPEVTMSSSRINTARKFIAWLTLFTFVAMPLSLVAQTQIKYHNNRYSPQDDVKAGRQAAQEAEQQFPLLRDETSAVT